MSLDEEDQPDAVHEERARLPELPKSNWLRRIVDGLTAAGPQAAGMLALISPGLGWISVAVAFLAEAGVPSLAGARADRYIREHLIPRIEELAAEHARTQRNVQALKERFTAAVPVDVTTQTIQAAIYTDDTDKYEILASAVITVLANAEWDVRADCARMLMRLLTDLTVTEWRILELFAGPRGWQERHHPLALSARDQQGRVLIGGMVLEALPDLATDPDTVYTALNAMESQACWT